jgi:predicted ester cyclase
MSLSPREFGQHWFEQVWNQGRRDAIAELCTPDIELHDGGVVTVGVSPFLQFFDRMQATFSDTHVDVEETIVEGDKACIRWTCKAKHTGDGFGISPTGVEINVTGISVARVVDGRMAAAWQNCDMLGMMQQINGGSISPTYVKP